MRRNKLGALFYTLTFILLLVTLTYSSLTSFKTTQFREIAIKKEFINNQREAERKRVKKKREDYMRNPPKEHASKNPEKEKNNISFGRINMNLFTDQAVREQQTKAYEAMYPLLKALIEKLYQDQFFYKNLLEKDPYLVENFIEGLKTGVPEHEKIDTKQVLNKTDFGSATLNEFSVKILKKNEEYPSFLSYITFKSSSSKILLRSAPLELLECIFGNQAIAQRVQEEADSAKDAKEFKEFVENNTNPLLSLEWMDFSLS
jgi:hypothetical protein